MRSWEDSRRFYIGLLIAALLVPAAWVTVVRWAGRDEDRARADLEARRDRLRDQRRGIYDVAEATASFLAANDKLDQDVRDLMERVEIPFHPWVRIPPEYEKDPAAYFRTKHEEQWDELHRACLIKGVTLCKDIGFDPIFKLPLNSRAAQENLNRLSIVTRVVKLLAEARVTEIRSILPGAPIRTGPERYGEIMREYSVQIVVRTKLDPLMSFLHKVRRPKEFFLVVRGMTVKGFDPYAGSSARDESPDPKELTAVISAAGMRFLKEEERKAARKKAPPRKKEIQRKWGAPLGA